MNTPLRDELTWPPGFAGRLADFIFHASPRPVREVAIAATLGLLGGVGGRACEISGSGCNVYVVLLALSGIGKEGAHIGIGKLMNLVRDMHGAHRFVDFDDMVSGPALHKAILLNPSFVNVAGEWGRKLLRMSSERDVPMQTLRTTITNAYAKSGSLGTLGGLKYSGADSNVQSLSGPAFSFLGEATPDTFYRSLTESMMEDGFMSRFNLILFEGRRPPLNDAPVIELEADELPRWRAIIKTALPYQSPICPPRIQVGYADEDACEKLAAFDRHCDDAINSTTENGVRQMWNRAHLKALRIAALLAFADSPEMPRISIGHATWAKTLVQRDIETMGARMRAGDVGGDDHARMELIRDAVYDYFTKPLPLSYQVPSSLKDAGYVAHKYIYLRVKGRPAFQGNEPKGTLQLLDSAVRGLVDEGFLVPADKEKVSKELAFAGKCYRPMLDARR